MLDWLDSFLITGLFQVVMVIGLALLLHLQLGLTRIANFGVVGFWGLGMYVFGVLYVQVDWPFGDPWQFLVCAPPSPLSSPASPASSSAGSSPTWTPTACWWARSASPPPSRSWPPRRTSGPAALAAWAGCASPSTWARSRRTSSPGCCGHCGRGRPSSSIARQVHRSPYGRLLIGMGANEPLARSLGKSTFRSKLGLFAVTSGAMGLLGALAGVQAALPRRRADRRRA